MFDSFVTPWTVTHQASLSMGFPKQEYWSGLPFPPPGDLPDPGMKPISCIALHCIAGGFFTTEPPGKPHSEQEKQAKVLSCSLHCSSLYWCTCRDYIFQILMSWDLDFLKQRKGLPMNSSSWCFNCLNKADPWLFASPSHQQLCSW